MKEEWFHGGPRIRNWRELSFDRDRFTSDLNAEGPGMYWTTEYEEAVSYIRPGGVHRAILPPGFKFLPNARPKMAQLRALFELADPEDQEIFLSNWNIEPPISTWAMPAINRALTKYTHQTSLHDAFVTLYHDLFRVKADAYVAAMESLGYDGVLVRKGTTGGSKKRKHLILWNVDAVRVEEM